MASAAVEKRKFGTVAPPRTEMVEVRLDAELLEAARELGLDVDEVLDRGLRDAVGKERRAREWYEENKAAIDSHNAWVEKHGLILDRYRQF